MTTLPSTTGWLALAAAAAGGLLLAQGRPGRPAFSFHDRTVLITGGSRGLGLALARALLAEGVSGLALCARDDGELERARQALAGGQARVLTVRTDVRDRAQVEALVRVVVSRLGRLDVLINNAGTIAVGPLAAMTLDDFEEAMATNFWGAVHATLAALPVMREAGGGRIVNIASIGGKVSVPHLVPYSASKFALVGFSHGLRSEPVSQSPAGRGA